MSLLGVVSEMNKFEQVSSNHPPDISLAGAVGMSRGYAQRGWGMSRGAALTMSLAYLRSTRDTPPWVQILSMVALISTVVEVYSTITSNEYEHDFLTKRHNLHQSVPNL